MEWLRYTRDAWGRESLAGLSFDLVWVALAVGLVAIALHLLYLRRCRHNRAARATQDGE